MDACMANGWAGEQGCGCLCDAPDAGRVACRRAAAAADNGCAFADACGHGMDADEGMAKGGGRLWSSALDDAWVDVDAIEWMMGGMMWLR